MPCVLITVCIQKNYTHVYTYTHHLNTLVCMYVSMYVCMYACMYTCLNVEAVYSVPGHIRNRSADSAAHSPPRQHRSEASSSLSLPGPSFDTLICARIGSDYVCARLRVYALDWRVYALVLRVGLCRYAALCARMRLYALVCVSSTNLCIKGCSR